MRFIERARIDRAEGSINPKRLLWLPLLAALSLSAALVVQQATNSSAALNPVAGSLFVGTTNTATATTGSLPTIPRGATWVADASVAGGHWWVGDSLQGICRLDPQTANPALGPWQLSNCNGTVKSGGQIAAGAVPGVPSQTYLYIADAASKSTSVVRFVITNTSATPTVGSPLVFSVPNITQKGGGLAGGRPVALTLTSVSATQDDLLVSYIKSGDIMRVRNVNNANANLRPTVEKIGSTSDGIGVNSFAMLNGDLYIAEVGGLGGVSKIVSPFGTATRPACSAASPCTAVATGAGVGFPGGMAGDGAKYLYVSDTRTGGATNYVYRVDVTKNPVITEMISNAVTPSYVAKDSSGGLTTFTSYVFPVALGYRAGNPGSLIVGDDPQFLAATVSNFQGHFWSLSAPPPPPVVSSISPSSGPANGGTAVTITGANLNVAGKATTAIFGGSAVPATCSTVAGVDTCTANSPQGTAGAIVDVIMSVGGQTSAAVAADQFTYTAAVVPTVSSVTPNAGDAAGGTVVTITGSNFTTDGSTSISFGPNLATAVTCTSTTSCLATSPAGIGPVDVIVTVTVLGGTVISPQAAADTFNYTPSVVSVAPATGSAAGGDQVLVTGTGILDSSTVTFGSASAIGACSVTAQTCTVTSPGGAVGTVDVRITTGTQTSPVVGADAFFYAQAGGATITSISPLSGATTGGTAVTIKGSGLFAGASVSFGGVAGSFVNCNGTLCTADTPPHAAGVVNVTVTATDPATNSTTTSNPAQFTYVTPAASLFAWGVTAPKGGAVFLPGALGGHWWSSDHAQGFCRQDATTTVPAGAVSPGHALNFGVCASDLVGSAGQGVYDPRPALGIAKLHYVYVPDNAVKSTAVWRLTFDSTTETMVADPIDGVTMATAMTPLADVRTLKPNGMALGPLNADGSLCTGCTGFGLYVTDLVDRYVRLINNPDGDPRTQTISLIAATGDARGANGTQGFIGHNLYISGNRATQFFDVTQCPLAASVCGMASVPAPIGVFVSGTATDPLKQLVYLSDSPGAANANILRYDASHDVYVPFPEGFYPPDVNGVVHCTACSFGDEAGPYVSGGVLPGAVGDNVVIATGTAPVGGVRPWDYTNHPGVAGTTGTTAPFAFAFGLAVGPNDELIITEDPSAGARSGRGTMWVVPFSG